MLLVFLVLYVTGIFDVPVFLLSVVGLFEILFVFLTFAFECVC